MLCMNSEVAKEALAQTCVALGEVDSDEARLEQSLEDMCEKILRLTSVEAGIFKEAILGS